MILQCLFSHVLAYTITANGVCLHLLVPPLAQCCFFGASCLTWQHVLQHKWVGVLSREKHPLQQLHSKKGGERIFEGGLIFGRLRYLHLLKLRKVSFFLTTANLSCDQHFSDHTNFILTCRSAALYKCAYHRLGGQTIELTEEQSTRRPVKIRRTIEWTDRLTIAKGSVESKLSVLRPTNRRADRWLGWRILDLTEEPSTQTASEITA